MHELGHFARMVMETPWCLGVMGFSLVFIPILGMWAVHKKGIKSSIIISVERQTPPTTSQLRQFPSVGSELAAIGTYLFGM
jgi:hypothetical protein